jgi:chromosome segregation ATPase
MAETRFIKTVTFGGYDKTDVDKRLEYLYSQLYEMKNELREAKLALEKFKEGADEEKAYESVLAGERAKLTQMQVKNENISERLKATEEDNKAKDKENKSLKETVSELEEALADANSKLSALQAGSDAAALGAVFIEAQKSRDLLLDTAKKEAEKLESDSKLLSENMIIEANNKSAKIIYDAEKQAAEITADAKNKSEQMSVASGNLRATMLADVEKIGSEVTKLKDVLESFEKFGLNTIDESQKLLKEVSNEIKNGGVPVFKTPENYAPQYPDEPEYQKVNASYAANGVAPTKKKNSELDKLQAMADALDGGKKKGGTSLDDLAKQAAALGGGTSGGSKKKSGGTSLDDLAKQAAAIDGGKSKKKSGGVDLAELAKQAAALDSGKK